MSWDKAGMGWIQCQAKASASPALAEMQIRPWPEVRAEGSHSITDKAPVKGAVMLNSGLFVITTVLCPGSVSNPQPHVPEAGLCLDVFSAKGRQAASQSSSSALCPPPVRAAQAGKAASPPLAGMGGPCLEVSFLSTSLLCAPPQHFLMASASLCSFFHQQTNPNYFRFPR